MSATLIRYEKFTFRNRFIVEVKVHQLSKSDRYPMGLKWSLICFDQKTGNRVLMDNHHPKGPHIHLDDVELEYSFSDLDSLVEDFRRFVLEHLGVRL